MDCPKCGAPIPADADKCAYCGNNMLENVTERIRVFNFGAFFLTWIWAFCHGLWGWGVVMLLLYPFQFIVFEHVVASGVDSFFYDMFPLLMLLKWILSFYLGFNGSRLAWKHCAKTDIDRFMQNQNKWGSNGAIYFFLLFVICVITPPPFYRARYKSSYVACVQQLKNIASGMEQEISENESLKNVHSAEDVCHHVLPGYDKPSACRGEVKKRADEVCVPGSLEFRKFDELKYEIKAISNERLKCNICVTETAVSPPKYGPEECAAAKCVH